MRRHWLSGPNGARFGRGLIAHREHEVHKRRIGLGKLVPVFATQSFGSQAVLFKNFQCKRIYTSCRMTPRAKALNLSFPRALRIASAIMLRAELPVHRNRTLNVS